MMIKESSDQTSDHMPQDTDPCISRPSGCRPDNILPLASATLISYSAGPPVNSNLSASSGLGALDADHLIASAQGENTRPSPNHTHNTIPVPLDILDQIPNLFRLLDLVEDRSSCGIAEKIVIDQKSLRKIINILQPGAYRSISHIDFKALDNLTIKPIGLYGNQLEIISYLQEIGCLNHGSEHIILHNSKGGQTSTLRSGLYLSMSRNSKFQGASKAAYIFYWPEEATWDDQASMLSDTIRRNRETFMRYLTKLSEQTIALISPSQAKQFIWETNPRDGINSEHEESDGESRLEEFQVFELDEQNEDAIASPGFQVSAESLFPSREELSLTDVCLVSGDERVGLLTQKRIEAYTQSQPFDESISQLKLREMIKSNEGQPQLVLGEISSEAMQILSSNGLSEKYPNIFEDYDRELEQLKNTLPRTQEEEQSHVDADLAQDRPVVAEAIEKKQNSAFQVRKNEIFGSLLESLRRAMGSPREASNLCILRLDAIKHYQNSQYSWSYNPQFQWRGTKSIFIPPQVQYDIYTLELNEYDRHQCQINEGHLPQPRVAPRQNFQFALATAGQSIELIQIVRNKCLLVVSDSEQGHTRIFIEDNVKLSRAIQSQGKITLHHEKLGGSKCLYAFDESTRYLAVVHGENDLQVTVLEFDEQFSSLRRHRSPIDLTEWYDELPEISRACFQSGRPELCLIESSGRVRVLSLVRRMFCGAPLKIVRSIIDIFPAPDGSCLLITVPGAVSSDPDRLLAFHWQSFGPDQQGIDVCEVPKSDARRVGTRFYGRGRIHIISWVASDAILTSTALQVKQKTTEFTFRSENGGRDEQLDVQTSNNSLIDCHLEVWTRFPLVSTVTRDTLIPVSRYPRRLIIVSPEALPQASAYFTRMISTLRNTTHKPVGEDLVNTIVTSTNSAKFEPLEDISEFKLGSYFVELICLIPLHLAITLDNKFMPLKDGVWDPNYESSLVGATIPEIKDSLSLGWYESIFGAYMASKHVRVVSSMGEQSVGKSYCLNHFADTSFAGSAMRTTEGVWLSCTPTKEYLLVSLDFEGIQSIERSAQEDMLLVLFNTAISNLVLFRNNFAFSRNIRGLFTSFQSSVKFFDPSSNPGLFNSTLALIIKDVTHADTKGIKKEFSLKFDEIVQMERDRNFISRLHRGKIQIIPWPVINSPTFYTLFNVVRKKMESQDFTHQTGGAFLHKLKSLMVDIKTCNWNASDQSQASLRAHQLRQRLSSALAHGMTAEGPLKNMNTDEDIFPLENDPEPDFFLIKLDSQERGFGQPWGENENEPQERHEDLADKALLALIHRSNPLPSARLHMKESEYVEILQRSLIDRLNCRLGVVERWMKLNTDHFTLDNPDLRELNKSFSTLSNAIQASIRLCQACCSECKLLCLRAYRHPGPHQCGTNHRCVFDCEVRDTHKEQPPCVLVAGHEGRHTCDVRLHSCGQVCSLSHLKGCNSLCNKPLDHRGECICSARLHLCGKACDLHNAEIGQGKRLYMCTGICHEPWDKSHSRHICDDARRGCPINCVMCERDGIMRDCANPNHFHGLEPKAVHLCASIHKCSNLCEEKGICAIEQAASEVRTLFSGTYEEFAYTEFKQVSKKLPCEVPIPAGQLSHSGQHKHDLRNKPFHFCTVRCPGCDYLCNLPLDHPQKWHSTNHGSMVKTKWVVEPEKDSSGKLMHTGYKFENHKYGSGDEGAPMMCSMMCSKQGRHVHVDFCLNPDNHTTPACEHIMIRIQPEPNEPKDWISHATYWERTGFEDPYNPSDQREFAKCDAICADPEHINDNKPSRCILSIFHPFKEQVPPAPHGYHISLDGHQFHCVDPSRAQKAYHVVFVIDSSGSMAFQDHRPMENLPVTSLLVSQCNNRYGAVLSALYGFLRDQEAVVSNAGLLSRQDAYSMVIFDDKAEILVENDFTSTPKDLIDRLVPHRFVGGGGTCYAEALKQAQLVIEKNWDADRVPMVVFLSDGDDNSVGPCEIEELCRKCIQLGHAAAFYGILFGRESRSSSLRFLVEVADENFSSAPPIARGGMRGMHIPCKFSTTDDTVQLAATLMSISESLPRTRASVLSRGGVGAQRF